MLVSQKEEGYVIIYSLVAITINNLEPGDNWTSRHKVIAAEFNMGLKGEKTAVDAYKKATVPPVLQDLEKLLHIK